MKVRWGLVLLVPAIFVFYAGLIPLFDAKATLSPRLVVGSAAVTALLLRREWLWDRYVAAMFLLVMLSLPGFAALATAALFHGTARAIALGVGALFLVLCGVLVRVLWQERHLIDLVPNWLLTHFRREQIYEDDGVAWALELSGADVAQGCTLYVYLQNNIEAERMVRLRLWDQSGFLLRAGKVRFPTLDPIRLPNRAQAIVAVGVAPSSDKPLKKIRIYIAVDAHGPAAARNRGWRAPPGPRPWSKWWVVLGALAGEIIWRRGGVFATVESTGGRNLAIMPSSSVRFV